MKALRFAVAVTVIVALAAAAVVAGQKRGAVAAPAAVAVAGQSVVQTSATVPATPPAPSATASTAVTAPASQTTASVAAPASAPVTSPVVAPGAAPSVIGAAAVALIRYPWAGLGYQLAFHGPKAGFLGLTDCNTHHIDIYVTPQQTQAQVEYVTAFEIAHAVDCTYTSAARQAEWPALRGFHLAGGWYPTCSCSEDHFASGDFAEVFANWQVGPVYPWRSKLAPAPTPAQLAALVPFLQG